MRSFLCAPAFCVLVFGTTTAQQPVSCDGTSPIVIKCPPDTIPTNYYESFTCQGELPGSVSCLHAIAFSTGVVDGKQDHKFGCSERDSKARVYREACVDNIKVSPVWCSKRITCKGVTQTKYDEKGNPVVYTVCSTDQKLEPTTKYPKLLLTSPDSCTETQALPGP
jgi:hypothetical protein